MNIKKTIFMLAATVTMTSGAIFLIEDAHAASPAAVEAFISAASGNGGTAYVNQMRNHFNSHPEISDSELRNATGLVPQLAAQIRAAYANGTLTKDDVASPEALMAALRAKIPGAVPLLNQIMAATKYGVAQAASLVSPETGASNNSNLLKNTGAKQNVSILTLFALISLGLTAAVVSQKSGDRKRCLV
ncbi:MAG: hypothetical protein LBF32_04525 [Streptococcaceae bacterium]|nr:hypothetical protein [Streptococcaceae bacterium]